MLSIATNNFVGSYEQACRRGAVGRSCGMARSQERHGSHGSQSSQGSRKSAERKPKSASKAETRPRRRRDAEDARAAILDAAERRLVLAGPAGIRLQEVAADVGVSHPTVLHHFGSREALVAAVIHRALERIHAEVVQAIGASTGG